MGCGQGSPPQCRHHGLSLSLDSGDLKKGMCSFCGTNPIAICRILNFKFALQVQELGLATAYDNDDGTYRFIRTIMALPFLPASVIPTEFEVLAGRATTDALHWVEGAVFQPEDWSMYRAGHPFKQRPGGMAQCHKQTCCGESASSILPLGTAPPQ